MRLLSFSMLKRNGTLDLFQGMLAGRKNVPPAVYHCQSGHLNPAKQIAD